MIKNAIKAVIGVGKNEGSFNPKPLQIILFAFLVAGIFLGTITLLLILASIVT
ncbi:hypothetical protein N9N08_01105 [bacterium]|nr:hypothetical protein [bacterium]